MFKCLDLFQNILLIWLLLADVVKTFKFKEDAEDMAEQLMKVKPFGHHPLPKFLKESI